MPFQEDIFAYIHNQHNKCVVMEEIMRWQAYHLYQGTIRIVGSIVSKATDGDLLALCQSTLAVNEGTGNGGHMISTGSNSSVELR